MQPLPTVSNLVEMEVVGLGQGQGQGQVQGQVQGKGQGQCLGSACHTAPSIQVGRCAGSCEH